MDQDFLVTKIKLVFISSLFQQIVLRIRKIFKKKIKYEKLSKKKSQAKDKAKGMIAIFN